MTKSIWIGMRKRWCRTWASCSSRMGFSIMPPMCRFSGDAEMGGWRQAWQEMLRDLPPDHPQRATILKGYQAMMAALLKYQGKDGMWRRLIDQDEAWPERRVRPCSPLPWYWSQEWVARREYLRACRPEGMDRSGGIHRPEQRRDQRVRRTGKKNDLQYYLDRKRRTGDVPGQAPIRWATSALLR